jgi:hypothetical protein
MLDMIDHRPTYGWTAVGEDVDRLRDQLVRPLIKGSDPVADLVGQVDLPLVQLPASLPSRLPQVSCKHLGLPALSNRSSWTRPRPAGTRESRRPRVPHAG